MAPPEQVADMWLGLTVLPAIAVFAFADMSELHDPFVGPAIRQRVGLVARCPMLRAYSGGRCAPVLTAALTRRRNSL